MYSRMNLLRAQFRRETVFKDFSPTVISPPRRQPQRDRGSTVQHHLAILVK